MFLQHSFLSPFRCMYFTLVTSPPPRHTPCPSKPFLSSSCWCKINYLSYRALDLAVIFSCDCKKKRTIYTFSDQQNKLRQHWLYPTHFIPTPPYSLSTPSTTLSRTFSFRLFTWNSIFLRVPHVPGGQTRLDKSTKILLYVA